MWLTSISSGASDSVYGLACCVGRTAENAWFDGISIVDVYARTVRKSQLLADEAARVHMDGMGVCETRARHAARCFEDE